MAWLRIEQLPHFLFQSGKGKGFLQQIDAGIEQAIMSNYILGVSRHEEHAHIGALRNDFLGHLTPIHPGHNYIGEQKMDCTLVAIGNL